MRKIDLMHAMFGKNHAHVCADCHHLCAGCHRSKQYYKCDVYGETRSEASDWRVGYPACGLWNKEYPKECSPIIRLVMPDKDTGPLEGQIDLFGGTEK